MFDCSCKQKRSCGKNMLSIKRWIQKLWFFIYIHRTERITSFYFKHFLSWLQRLLVQISNVAFICGLCMTFPCMRDYSVSSPVSFHNLKHAFLAWLVNYFKLPLGFSAFEHCLIFDGLINFLWFFPFFCGWQLEKTVVPSSKQDFTNT